MSKFFSSKHKGLVPYTPGEQPQDKSYVKLNTNESPFPPSPYALRLARQAAGDNQLYSDPTCGALTKIACEKFGVESDEVIFTNGSDEILNFAFFAFCDEENGAIFPDITYGFYPVFAELYGIPYTEIPLRDDFTINVEDYCTAGKNIFIANPNAPTGIALSKAEVEKIVQSNPNNVVVIDEAYVDFGGESCVDLIHKYNNLLVTQTFSKSRSLAGARLGMGFGVKKLIADLNTVKYSTNPYNVNRMTMAAGTGALIDGDYFDACRGKIIKTRKRLADELRKMGFFVPDSSANFVFAKHDGISGMELYLKLKKEGVLVRHFEKDRLKDYNRITVGSDEQIDILLEKVKEILGDIK